MPGKVVDQRLRNDLLMLRRHGIARKKKRLNLAGQLASAVVCERCNHHDANNNKDGTENPPDIPQSQ